MVLGYWGVVQIVLEECVHGTGVLGCCTDCVRRVHPWYWGTGVLYRLC